METTQPITTSTQDTLESPRTPQWAWNYPAHNLRYANKLMDSSATSTPFQPLANPSTCIAALYAKSTASISSKCSLQLRKATTTSLPSQITQDVWIPTNPATAPTDTISLICPEKPMETFPIPQLLHVLKLPTACSATSAHFYLPPRYEIPVLNVSISLNMANLQTINITAQHFHVCQHMGSNRSETQLQHLATIPSIPVHKVYQHLLNSSL